MGARAWTLSCLLICSFVALAAGPAAVRKQVESSMLVTGSLEIEPDGHVSRIGIDRKGDLPPAVVELVEKHVPGWTFEPVILQGKAARVSSKMSLRVVAKKLDDDNYRVEIRSASFGENTPVPGETVTANEKLKPPMYPEPAWKVGAMGTVYVVMRIGRDGKVEDAIAEQVNLKIIANEQQMKQLRDMFARSALGAARKWAFQPPTSGDFADKAFWSIRVPVDYALADGPVAKGSQPSKYGQWETYVPGPRQAAPWVTEHEASSSGVDAIAGGAVQHIGSGPRLLTPLQKG